MKYSISESVRRLDHDDKIRGTARYAADYIQDSMGRPLNTGRLIRAMIPHGTIRRIDLPALTAGYHFVGPADVPVNIAMYPIGVCLAYCSDGEKYALEHSMPLFAEKEVEYAGQPVGMLVGPDEQEVRRLAALCSVEVDPLPAFIDFIQSKDLFGVI